MHHWKLSEEEEEVKSSTYWEYNGWCGLGGQAMVG